MMLAVTYPPLIAPWMLLSIVVALGIAAVAARRHRRRARVRWLTGLAREHHMTFSPTDRFDLTRRLGALPEWAPQAIDLVVSDVLYAAHGLSRQFIATATYRRTFDERPHQFVFACAERLPENELDPNSIRPARASGADQARYREVMDAAAIEADAA